MESFPSCTGGLPCAPSFPPSSSSSSSSSCRVAMEGASLVCGVWGLGDTPLQVSWAREGSLMKLSHTYLNFADLHRAEAGSPQGVLGVEGEVWSERG